MERTAYLADSDSSNLEMLASYLSRDGFQVESFRSCGDLPAACKTRAPDLVIMDISDPEENGLGVCSALRSEYPQTVIIALSDKNTPYDRVTGLMIGFDDYMSKPYLPIELQARVRVLFRRSQTPAVESRMTAELSFGPLTLFPDQRTAQLSGSDFPLTPTEFDFLALLVERNGSAVSRTELLDKLWKVTWNADTRATDDLVKRLRKKLRACNSAVSIETVWGYGFRLALTTIS